jgi:hypothetical protein
MKDNEEVSDSSARNVAWELEIIDPHCQGVILNQRDVSEKSTEPDAGKDLNSRIFTAE